MKNFQDRLKAYTTIPDLDKLHWLNTSKTEIQKNTYEVLLNLGKHLLEYSKSQYKLALHNNVCFKVKNERLKALPVIPENYLTHFLSKEDCYNAIRYVRDHSSWVF